MKKDVKRSRSGRNWLSRLRQSPSRFDFMQVIRILRDSPVFNENMSIIPHDSGELLESEVGSLARTSQGFALTVAKPALTGIQGVLPHSLRDLVRKVIHENSCYSLRDFINVFNNRVLWCNYNTEALGQLTLYLEQKTRESSLEEKPIFNFGGTISNNNKDSLEYHPYAMSMCMRTNSLAGAEKLMSHYVKAPVTIECDKGKRWPIESDCCWQLSSNYKSSIFKLGHNTVIGRYVWMLGATINVILHYENNLQWQKQLRHTPRFSEKITTMAQSILPFHYIRYFVELPTSRNTDLIISSRKKSYRLAYHNTYYKNAKEYIRISWK